MAIKNPPKTQWNKKTNAPPKEESIEPVKWNVFAYPEFICVKTANGITQAVFDKTFSPEIWKSSIKILMGTFPRDIAETKAAIGIAHAELLMGGCSCPSVLTFKCEQE